MPIFSSNRVSSVGTTTVVAAEGYTENDFGRILSECAVNDMRLFNAAIARDFQEVDAMTEGTMLESEIEVLREFSMKEAWKGLKEKLKKLWSKIKGVFKTVYAKLTLWLVKYNKAYIAMHRKELLNKNCRGCKISKFRDHKFNDMNYESIMDKYTKYTNANDEDKNFDKNAIKDYFKGDFLDKIVADGADFKGADKYYSTKAMPSATDIYEASVEVFFDEANENLTFGSCNAYAGNVQKLLSNLSGSCKALKDLKKSNNDIDKVFKKAIKKLNDAETKASNSDKEEEKNKAEVYKAASSVVGKFQTVVNAASAAVVKLIKFSIKNDRGLIATLVAYDPKAINDSAMLEFAYATGFDTLHEETEDMTPEDVEAEADELNINIEIEGGDNVNVNVEDETDD